MSFKCQIFQRRLTFNNNVFAKNCDVRLIIILCVISAILPMIKCAKLENPQIRLLINDDDLLQEKTNIHEAGSAAAASQHDNSGEHFNLYRSELKRLSYETIHRILRDENEPSYRREETELRYYQKRSPSYEESHQLIKRSTKEKEIMLNLSQQNLTEFVLTPQIHKRLNLVSGLDLSHNFIAQLNTSVFSNITSLNSLNLQNNSFTSIPLSQATTLRTLNLNHNLIKTSLLPSNIYLRNLYLSNNLIENLSSIELALLKNLESLDISHNLLQNSESSFFTQRMHNLKHLNLAFNQLGSIYRETFYNLLSLNTLLLSHNNISDIDYETFLALPNLQYLDLSFNGLKGKSIRALQGITGLVALNIAFNPEIGAYMQEFVASWSLKELDASGTGLCQIPAALAQSVRSLKLTHNWLKVINCGDLDSYPLLQYLDLSFSHIEHIEDDALGRLEILEILMLDHNQLRKVPYSLPVSLEHLFLQNNEIMEIPQQTFQGLNNLKTLDLSHNKLLYLPDIMLPKLQTLNLQSSEIRGISQGIIHSLPKLNDLMLEDNPIKCADLLGIAEWASTCRLRVEKENEEEGEQLAEEDNFMIRIQDLKNKFEKMHNFYEQFGLNSSFLNNSLLSELKAPSCVQENLNAGPSIKKNFNTEEEAVKEEIKFNQNSMTSSTLLSTAVAEEKTLTQHSNNQTDAVSSLKHADEEEKQQQQLKDETAVKPITIETATQTLPAAMQSSSLNEKQTFNTTTKTFSSYATTTTTAVATTTIRNTASNKLLGAGSEGQEEPDIVVKPRFANEMKTFDHLTANADAVATTTPTTTTFQHEEIASIGNTPTESSSNMTEVVEAVEKHTKEAEQQLEDVQHKTNFQTTKSKKWLKQATPLKGESGGGGIEMPQNMEILLKQDKTKDINAAQFIKSTTFATPINSETQTTTIASPTPTITTTFVPTSAALETTTMAEAFIQLKQENKHVNETQRRGSGEHLKEKDADVVDFESTTSKLEINLGNEQQQHEIKTKIANTKEIKTLAARNPKTMQTKITDTATTTTTTTLEATTTNKRMAKITLKIPPELTANLDKPNKELKGFMPANTTTNTAHTTTQTMTTNSAHIKTTTRKIAATTTTIGNKPIEEEKHDVEATTSITAAILKTFKTIEAKTTATASAATTTATTILVGDKDLASNYQDTENNRQITKTINKTSNILAKPTTNSSSNITSTTSSTTSINGYNKNNQIAKKFDIATTTTTTSTTTAAITSILDHHQQQQQHHLLDILMPNYRQSLQKDVNVKCMQSTSNECNSSVKTTTATSATQRQDELGRTPTIEATLEQTTASKTSTENPTKPAAAAVAASTTTVMHKHEPLQLLVKDRHLIGTPLLMYKGENLMVTADELILPANKHNAEHEDNSNSINHNTEHHDLETNTMAADSKNKHNLEISQTARAPPATAATTPNKHTKTEHKINKSTNKKCQEDIKLDGPADRQDDLGKIKKPNYEIKTKKHSLIMKKMTIITKQHDDKQHVHTAEPQENEVHAKQFDNSHYQELKPLAAILEKDDSAYNTQAHTLKHSTVNTPINSDNQDNRQAANLLKQPHTFQHEHELLIQQILQDQQAETHAKHTKTEQWSDLRRAESKENHPGLILLVSSGLFLVLLLGLMHVYRCDMPWRRHSPSHHLRPHQRPNHSVEDDSHSFLSYSEGMQKWHHSTRLEAPYNSPLHNLHVRELQKTSATEKPATVKTAASNFKAPPLSHSMVLNNSRSLSQSSTTKTSTASASSSAILDDESFYIEMTPDSGQFSRALQSELLPMELLNMAQIQTLDYQDTMGDSQTSMEDDCVVHYQQQQPQQQRYPPHLTSLTSSTAALPCSTSSPSRTTTSLSVKPQTQSRKFGLW
ncbi:uncharacterized protein 2mit [Calliphora vicina]|uniref:uncharacterized protein 2mit n=1 Tax=Calliphora vicina TaxID=7373 RepID=UPI00325B887A